ncbi:MAG: DUF3313 family protein [Xanthomonadales bacterium]|nr:DUF3313 family protein [Xanthomonadales bacterium]
MEAIDLNHLERVSKTRLDDVFVRSGVSLEQFRAVVITQPGVSFRESWLRDQNRQRDGEKIKAQDMERIGARVSGQLVSILETGFVERGYEVVSAPARGVLIVEVQITDLDVVGPDTFPATQVETFSEYSSTMTLEVQLLDGASNEVLFWSRDRQRDLRRGYLQSRTRTTNNRDSRQMIGSWAEDLFDTLDRA